MSGRASYPAKALLISVCILAGGCLSKEAIRRIEGHPGQEGTGIFLSRLPEVTKIIILDIREPTPRQLAISSARLRAFAAAVDSSAETPARVAATFVPPPAESPDSNIAQPLRPDPAPQTAPPEDQQVLDFEHEGRDLEKVFQPAVSRKLPRFVAVETESDELTKGQAVMIFDTKVQRFSGVLDVEKTPAPGSMALWRDIEAIFVGSGGG